MKPISHKSKKSDVITISLLTALLVFSVVGCASRRMRVVPLRYQDVLALSSDDIVRVMRQAGFSNEQILEHGEDIHDALAYSGAADIKIGRAREAVFAINGDAVYISSRMRGNSIYNVKTGWVDGP